MCSSCCWIGVELFIKNNKAKKNKIKHNMVNSKLQVMSLWLCINCSITFCKSEDGYSFVWLDHHYLFIGLEYFLL